jgi:hypothetical protein
MGTMHRIADSPRFDPAPMTWAAADRLRRATSDRPLAEAELVRLEGTADLLVHSYPRVGPTRMMEPVTDLLIETARTAQSRPSMHRSDGAVHGER